MYLTVSLKSATSFHLKLANGISSPLAISMGSPRQRAGAATSAQPGMTRHHHQLQRQGPVVEKEGRGATAAAAASLGWCGWVRWLGAEEGHPKHLGWYVRAIGRLCNLAACVDWFN